MRETAHTNHRFGSSSVNKAASASMVVVGHVVAILAFAQLGPSFVDAVNAPPLQITLLPAAVAAVEPPPPLVKLEPPRVELEPPIVPLIELPAEAPSTTAITLASERTPLTQPTGGVPTLVSDVEYLAPPRPGYPSVSRRLREQGLVVLRVLVDERGRAELLHVHRSSGHARLDQAAVEAVQRAEFKPYVANGLVQRVYVLVPIEFALNRSTNPHG
jgi:protein TonB